MSTCTEPVHEVGQAYLYLAENRDYQSEDLGKYQSFAIIAKQRERILVTVEDVTQDEAWLGALLERLNAGQAAPEQLIDILGNVLP